MSVDGGFILAKVRIDTSVNTGTIWRALRLQVLQGFRHPTRAAYVFGAERYSLSPKMLSLCEFVVKIPTRFSINVGMAGAIVLYDRMMTQGGYARRVTPSGGEDVPPPHTWGAPLSKPRDY